MIFSIVLVYIISNGFGVEAVEFNTNYGLVVRQFPAGENVVLRCDSVDEKHNFHYWYHVNTDDIIGPYQGNFNRLKYGYEVLSGNLTIRNINKHDAGLYNCVSRGVRSDSTKIASIGVSVVEDIRDTKGEVNSLKIILAICSLILFFSFLYAAYSLWRDRYKHPRYLEQFDDDEDIEDNGEEIYRAPSTSGIIKPSIVKETTIKEKDFERPLISTDFESILDSRI
ncbi:uncharacterized protein LOC123315221 [Coccinella septempunctata]|uniref:uncharacterized protein LOC123315221 n=1 Tax=Coccinella septempunctata TaxID=41139 RepID=UPI001D074DA8|nr:uncharacterized protein LOC123315221 [Coccinella septempunctata]